jgi:hypothetical protein
MGFIFQDSSRLQGWILSTLFALVSCAAALGASDASPANRLPSSGVRGDAELGIQDLSMGAPTPTPDLSQDEPDRGTASSSSIGHGQSGPRSGEGGQTPGALTRKQREGVLKSDFEKMKQDAAELTTLAKSLEEELEKSNEHILSLTVVEKAQKIEGLAKRIAKTAKSY